MTNPLWPLYQHSYEPSFLTFWIKQDFLQDFTFFFGGGELKDFGVGE